jgi:hypothetical protein
MGVAKAFFTAGLGFENRLHLLAGALVTGHSALYLQLFRCIHHQYALGQLVLTGLNQQRRNQNGVGRCCAGQVLRDFLAD